MRVIALDWFPPGYTFTQWAYEPPETYWLYKYKYAGAESLVATVYSNDLLAEAIW